jgi:alkanesulfonate monooxygenase SsuD/methylene tetrahydromethanopterin reductase-like flavin-dependent oxidoreductase (luciferase family)
MKFDLFLSICQTEVDGHMPSERQMFQNFFSQVKLADQLGFGTAWVAETHLSCQVQKENPGAVIPEFKGEIGLNTDILQLAHKVFSQTENIHVGSAIRNIIANGGPIAHAEAVKTFLTLHGLEEGEKRKLHLGFAAGRFPFSNTAYGFLPRTELEKAAWDVIKNKYFQEATEIFLKALKHSKLSSKDISDRYLEKSDFRDEALWQKSSVIAQKEGRLVGEKILLDHHWNFETVGVLPFEAPLELLELTIGSHDPEAQIQANEIFPVGVFNLSITPSQVIEQTHERMNKYFHPDGGAWNRTLMPRTLLLFIDETPGLSSQAQSEKARAASQKAWENYWRAMEGTLDPKKIASAVENTISGNPQEVREKILRKYDKNDRLMLWFDFNNHSTESVENSMRIFMEKVAPHLL